MWSRKSLSRRSTFQIKWWGIHKNIFGSDGRKSHITTTLNCVKGKKKHICCMLKLTMWKFDAGVHTHRHTQHSASKDAGVERVVFVWNEWTPSYFSSHISPPPPPFASFISSLLSSHPLNLQFSHLLWAVSLSGPLPLCKFISFHSSLLW